MKSNGITRIRTLLSLIALVALVLAIRLYVVQVVDGSVFADEAQKQYVSPTSDTFDRGTIYFETKGGVRTTAATLASGYTLGINPSKVTDAQKLYESIREVVTIDPQTFFARASKKGDPYEELAKHVSEADGGLLRALADPAIELKREYWRNYPLDSLAAQTIGIVGYKDDVLSGRYGLERQYDDILTREGKDVYVNFFAEVLSNIKESVLDGKEHEGDIVTTIEPTVQAELEKELKGVLAKWQSRFVGGIIMDPKTGEIYALATAPSFNPNNLNDVEDISLLGNPLVEDFYEMGSIVKPLTMAAGIDAGVVTSKSRYFDNGFLILNNSRISNFDGKGRGDVDMQEVLSQSLNTGVAHVVTRLGSKKFAEYLRSFGFGQETGIDLPNETSGLVTNLNSTRDIEFATASYGQGVALSPIQMVRALSALGNGGTLPSPHVAKRIEYGLGVSRDISPAGGNKEKQVISKEASEEITRMLVEVVDTALLNGKIKQEHYSIAAKTGTAQIAKPSGGGYYDDRYLHSFFGYAPAYDPKFIIFLFNVEPKGAQYSSETLTLPFIDLMKFLLHYYEVPPDRNYEKPV
jgi:stage V sporulation protein D (sporulation-specific penicillin-binding protein)